MQRRDFIAGLGAAAWPLAARAQQRALPVVGYLSSDAGEPSVLAAFRKGLSETGYAEGRNVTIETRFANNVNGRLAELAADLVRRRVTVIHASGLDSALAAKAATRTIPIVFRTGADPVQYGLVASFNRPSGNVTGINSLNLDLEGKRLGLLHDLLPRATRFAVLVQSAFRQVFESGLRDLRAAASTIGASIEVVEAGTDREIDAVFATLVQKRIDALLVQHAVLFFNRRLQLVTLATYHRLPAMYAGREYVEAGGLISYGSNNLADEERLAGNYVGRILKGDKPSDLPVMRPTRFEFVINLKTARILGIEVPPQLLAITDEAIE